MKLEWVYGEKEVSSARVPGIGTYVIERLKKGHLRAGSLRLSLHHNGKAALMQSRDRTVLEAFAQEHCARCDPDWEVKPWTIAGEYTGARIMRHRFNEPDVAHAIAAREGAHASPEERLRVSQEASIICAFLNENRRFRNAEILR